MSLYNSGLNSNSIIQLDVIDSLTVGGVAVTGGGGGSGTATAFATTGADVAIDSTAPTIAGQSLISTSTTTATWQTPAGGGDTLAPATNTNAYIPTWNGLNSKTLNDGINPATLVTTTTAQNVSNKTITTSLPITDTTASTDPNTGALIVDGGVGIKKSLNVALTIDADGDISTTADINTDGSYYIDGSLAVHRPNGNSIFINSTPIGVVTGGQNVCSGSTSGDSLLAGERQSLYGVGSGTSITSGSNNSSFGNFSMGTTTTGTLNTSIGAGADTSSGAAYKQLSLGAFAVNTKDRQCIIGDLDLEEVVPAATADCFLGTAANSFSGLSLKDTGTSIASSGNGILYKKTSNDGLWWKGDTTGEIDLTAAASPLTTLGDIITRGASVDERLAIGSATQVLTVAGGVPTWATPASGGMTDPMTTRGDMIYKDAANATVRLPTGTVGQLLSTDGTDTAWTDPLVIESANDRIGVGTGAVVPADNTVCLGNTSVQSLCIGDSDVFRHDGTSAYFGHFPVSSIGAGNLIVGTNTSVSLSSGASNTFIGSAAADNVTTGSNNVAVGQKSLDSMTSRSGCTAVGMQALKASSAADMTAVGFNAGSNVSSLTANNSTFIGSSCLGVLGALQEYQLVLGSDATATKGNQCMIGHSGMEEIVVNAGAAVTLGTDTNAFTGVGLKDVAAGPTVTATHGALYKKTGSDGLWWKGDTTAEIDISAGGGGSGDVVGPASATDGNIALYDGTTGKLIKNGPDPATLVTLVGAETLTNKTLTTPIISTISNTGTLTLPTSTGTLALLSDITGEANTSSNSGVTTFGLAQAKAGVDLPFKSLTATSTKIGLTANANDVGLDVNEANLTIANMSDAASYATIAGVETLTNKTLTSTTNSINSSGLHSATTVVDVIAATAPTNGQVLTASSSTAASWVTPTASAGAYAGSRGYFDVGTSGNLSTSGVNDVVSRAITYTSTTDWTPTSSTACEYTYSGIGANVKCSFWGDVSNTLTLGTKFYWTINDVAVNSNNFASGTRVNAFDYLTLATSDVVNLKYEIDAGGVSFDNTVIIGGATSGSDNRAITTDDGVNYTGQGIVGITNVAKIAYKASNTTWIAVGSGTGAAVMATSTDMGTTWTGITTHGVIGSIQYVMYSAVDDLWVIGGPGLARWSDDDGVTWTGCTGTLPTSSVFGIAHDGIGRYIMTGSGTNRTLTSTDGKAWANQSSMQSAMPYPTSGVCYSSSQGIWVIFGDSTGAGVNRYATSVNGTTWIRNTTETTNIPSGGEIAYSPSNDRFVSVGSVSGSVRAAYCTTPTGSWTTLGTAAGLTPVDVCWNGTVYISVGISPSGLANYSSDGISWTTDTSLITGANTCASANDLPYAGAPLVGVTTVTNHNILIEEL